MSAIRDQSMPEGNVSPLEFYVASSLKALPHEEAELLAEVLSMHLAGHPSYEEFMAAAQVFKSGKLSRRDTLRFLIAGVKAPLSFPEHGVQ